MSVAISLHLKGKQVVIVGGGKVAYRKAHAYLKEGAILSIVAPQIISELKTLTSIHFFNAPFSWEIVNNPFLMYVATDNVCLNMQIVKEAEKRGILCGCATRCEDVTFSSMMQVEYEHLQVAVLTKSSFPYANSSILQKMKPYHEEMNQKLESLQVIREYILVHNIKQINLWEELFSSRTSVLAKVANAIKNQHKIIILAYHGVSDVSVVENDMMDMMKLCETTFANVVFLEAFISERIQIKAKERGFHMDTLTHIVHICRSLSLPYAIQPMLLNNATYMKILQDTYSAHHLGVVLCNSEDDAQELVSSFLNSCCTPLCVLHHASESKFSSWLKKANGIYSYAYDDEVPKLTHPVMHIQAFSILIGYHAYKDIEGKWIVQFEEQGIDVIYQTNGLLHFSFVREKFIKKIQAII